MKQEQSKIAILIGTRPEAIKMAPVVKALRNSQHYAPQVLLSGQQKDLSRSALKAFGLESKDVLVRHFDDYSLSGQASGYLDALSAYLKAQPVELMLVHGDTTTGFIGALAAFYQQIPVGHVEAGLRSNDLENPFPEEAHRRLIDPLCRLLFAPTQRARHNLINENANPNHIIVTGNTVVDAVHELATSPVDLQKHLADFIQPACRLILLTAHRRENWGAPMKEICGATRTLADRYSNLRFIVPVHPNPNVSSTVHAILGDHPHVLLVPPLNYMDLIAVMRRAYLILTDSGGIQEEAPCVGTPVLILRKVTERPEVVEGGCGRLIGTGRDDIIAQASTILEDPVSRERMIPERNPFGDGKAALRIVRAIDNWRHHRPLDMENNDFTFDPEIPGKTISQ
ncbi:WecB: UDP-N-acetylglucosamine 2-epimerase [Desulfosarcina variabilis str. Montpellier]|uniref:non-hydrolyzing UDP-N-acetylglucosamine 2-epimerase n=1 Tax=Desulfosarcina variabilis TaxID=2300 RepID=UPI003AFAC447